MSLKRKEIFEFGEFRLDVDEHTIERIDGTKNGVLPEKAFQTLVLLVRRRGHLVSKEELISFVWPDTIVEDNNLEKCVHRLRHFLGESSDGTTYIETVRKHGYRFVGRVQAVEVSFSWLPESFRNTDEQTESPEAKTDHPTEDDLESTTIRPSLLFNRWSILLMLVLLMLGGLFLSLSPGGLRDQPLSSNNPVPIQSLAVLPFSDSADPNSEYLSEGIAENLIDRLSRLPNFKVISLKAVSRYTDKDIETIRDELKVKAILTGNLARRDNRILLSVELINAEDSTRLWGAKYDRNMTELLAVQNEIGQKVVERLNLDLTGEQLQAFNKRYTESTEAYQFYLKGRHLWNKRTGENLRRAVDFFNQAVTADPNYAPAYAGLADCYALYSSYEITSGADSFPKAKAMAVQALALDDTLAEAHTSLAFVLYRFERNWPAAEGEFKRALELNPNYATAHHWYGEYLGSAGRFDEAFAHLETALVLDPLSFIVHVDFGWIYYLARRYDDAIAQYKKAREIESQSSILDYNSYGAYEQATKYSEAADAYVAAMQSDGFGSGQIESLKRILQASGYNAFKRAALEMRMQKYRLSSIEIASNRAFLGEREEAFILLEKAIQDHDADLVYLKFHPSFDNLRDDPRFADLVRRVEGK